ncbi:DUF397 domain-containing protein [Streptomyces sp. NPDC005811]
MMENLAWFKSSYSDGPRLQLSPKAWADFVPYASGR